MNLLRETIESIKKQSYKTWEVLVVDDGSSSEQWDALQSIAEDRIRVLRRVDGVKGPSRCRNIGVAKSSGQYLMFVDSDDILAPWCLSQRITQATEEAGADLWVFPVMLFSQSPGDLAICWNRLEGDDDAQRFLHSDPPWHTSSPLWRKEFFLDVGGFNERVLYGDDSDLHMRTVLSQSRVRKYPALLPDLFVRRGDEIRITSHLTRTLIDSRQVRLQEGTKSLMELNVRLELMRIWEGQYFIEGEELLFNAEDARDDIHKVIKAWVEQFRPSSVRRQIVRAYFTFGLWAHKKAYFLLRVARRIAKIVLPDEYFPSNGEFHKWVLGDTEFAEIRKRLQISDREQGLV